MIETTEDSFDIQTDMIETTEDSFDMVRSFIAGSCHQRLEVVEDCLSWRSNLV